MSIIDIEFIHCYVKLQSELISATRAAYPNAKDMKWMLDFPKSGIIEIDDYQWSFIKHGSGLKLIRQKVSPFITVDIHKYFDEPKAFDSWRLVEFLNSFGENVNEEEIIKSLDNMCSIGLLTLNKNGKYYSA